MKSTSPWPWVMLLVIARPQVPIPVMTAEFAKLANTPSNVKPACDLAACDRQPRSPGAGYQSDRTYCLVEACRPVLGSFASVIAMPAGIWMPKRVKRATCT